VHAQLSATQKEWVADPENIGPTEQLFAYIWWFVRIGTAEVGETDRKKTEDDLPVRRSSGGPYATRRLTNDLDSMRQMEPPILIDVWTVDPSQRVELARAISDGVRNVMVGRRGFVSAQLYESTNGDAMMVMVRMRTIEERQELTDSPEAHSLVRELGAIAHAHVRLFRLVESFGESDEPH
jgi:hypothetical protein